MDREPVLPLKRWPVVAGALIVQVILGTVYAFSVFVSPLEREFGWGRTTTQWAFSIALVTFAVTMIPAGRLQDRLGPRRVATVGGILLGLSFVLGSLLLGWLRSPAALYLTYGILGGAGIGFAYVCPIAAAVKWFPDKKGLITGLAVAGFGAGALFFAGPASTLLLPPGEGEAALGISQILLVGLGITVGEGFGIGWKSFFILHGLVCGGGVFLGATLLRNPPSDWSPPGWKPSSAVSSGQELEWREMLNTPLSCMLWLTFIFGATSGLMAIGQWKPMMETTLGGATFAPDWMGGFGRFVEPVGILALFNALAGSSGAK